MINKLILISILFVPFFLYAQSDCIKHYQYSGNLARDVIQDSSRIIIRVPSTTVLVGYETEISEYDSLEIKPQEEKFKRMFLTHMGYIFCNSSEYVIENVFKGNNKNYRIIIEAENKRKEVFIEVDKIEFKVISDSTLKGGHIEVNLGNLEW